MKKTYINPELEVVDLQINCTLLAGSPVPTSEETPDEWGAPILLFGDE